MRRQLLRCPAGRSVFFGACLLTPVV